MLDGRDALSAFVSGPCVVVALDAAEPVFCAEQGEQIGGARAEAVAVGEPVRTAHGQRGVREYEHVTLARVLLAQHRIAGSEPALGDTAQLLERLLAAAEAGGRTGTVIEILVLQALAAHARGDFEAALAPLERALRLAEPEGYVRAFIAEGAPMTSMLAALGQRRPDWAYPRALLDTARHPQDAGTSSTRRPPGRASSTPSATANWKCFGCSQPSSMAPRSHENSSCR